MNYLTGPKYVFHSAKATPKNVYFQRMDTKRKTSNARGEKHTIMHPLGTQQDEKQKKDSPEKTVQTPGHLRGGSEVQPSQSPRQVAEALQTGVEETRPRL